VKEIATPDFDDSVALAMKHIFSRVEVSDLDIADGLKRLLYEKKYDLNSLLQSDAASVARELGIEGYVAKIIIDAAKRKATE
jgi:hypothetical protein